MSSEPLPLSAIAALQANNKIEAIKLTREATGLDLKNAKERVDAYLVANPSVRLQLQAAQSKTAKSFFNWLVMMALVTATVMYFWPR